MAQRNEPYELCAADDSPYTALRIRPSLKKEWIFIKNTFSA